MAPYEPSQSFRVRYLFGLTLLAVAVVFASAFQIKITERQERNGALILAAGDQVGLVGRIAFFASQMATSKTEDEFNVARQQLGRATNRLLEQHESLLNGNSVKGLPKIETPALTELYFGPGLDLDRGLHRFVNRAEVLHKLAFGDLSLNHPAYLFVVTYGPHALEPLLEEAVTKYEVFNRREIKDLQDIQVVLAILVLLIMLFEGVCIFRPLENRLRQTLRASRLQREQIEREKNLAEMASQAKTHFLANMSHELRTPLNAIIGFSEVMKYGVYGKMASVEQENCLDDIHKSGRHLLALVNDILDVSAAEGSAICLESDWLDPVDVALEAMAFVQVRAQERGVTVSLAPHQPRFLLNGDERRVNQVLTNLLSNAIKFTDKGGLVTLDFSVQEGGRGAVTVTDTGIGMTLAEVSKARERFGMVRDASIRKPEEGAGLGLPIVIELMRLHQGDLDIHSIKGQGTRMTALFPSHRTRPLTGGRVPEAEAAE
ncbi:MAG: sensor histidine kinase [Rhodospirillales bacterium]